MFNQICIGYIPQNWSIKYWPTASKNRPTSNRTLATFVQKLNIWSVKYRATFPQLTCQHRPTIRPTLAHRPTVHQHKCLTNCSWTSTFVTSTNSALFPLCNISIVVLDSICFKWYISLCSGKGWTGRATVRDVFFRARATVLRNLDHCRSLAVASGVLQRDVARSSSAQMQLRVNWKEVFY